jgi:hypothetical protein
MKLYATVTSERATKGQGGNDRLDIQLTVRSATEQVQAGVIAVREIEPDMFSIVYKINNEGININTIDLRKIKR